MLRSILRLDRTPSLLCSRTLLPCRWRDKGYPSLPPSEDLAIACSPRDRRASSASSLCGKEQCETCFPPRYRSPTIQAPDREAEAGRPITGRVELLLSARSTY